MRTTILLTITLLLAACGPKSQGPTPEFSARAIGPGLDASRSPSPPEPVNLSEDEAARTSLATAIALWQRRHDLEKRLVEDLSDRASRDRDLAALNHQALRTRGFQALFWVPEGPTRHLRALFEALRGAADHAFPDDRHRPEALEALLRQVDEASARAEPLRRALEVDPVFEVLRGLVLAGTPPSAEEVEGLDRAGRFRGIREGDRQRVLQAQQRWLEAYEALGRARNALEVEAQEALWRWALDLRFRVRASPFRAHQGDGEAVKKNEAGLLAFWDRFGADPEAALQELVPAHPDYRALQGELRRYREMAREGPFPVVSLPGSGSLRRGSRGPLVEALRSRLAREGYLAAREGASFDREVEEAVKAYQASHGFDATGVVEERHVRSMNVPLDQRVRQIELGLQRWRESEVRPQEPLYVRVNIPEFMMMVYQGGRRVMHHRIVCGNNNWDVDPDSRIEGRINRTKIFSASIERIIINPRWYVPGRIRKLELDYELLQEPDYYRRRNFVVKTRPDGTEEVYQDSGDHNALGRVKFVFPNPYGIFMHDTNLKSFFRKEIRAFSHGCIRLQDPFEVMDLLLQEGAGIPPEKGRAILAKGEMREIPLKTPIPIFIEYNSVGVDDQGRVQFYSDVYGYDRDYFDGKIPYSQEELNLLTRKITRFD